MGNFVIDMYTMCEYLEDEQCLFDRLLQNYVISWNIMIVGYAHNGFDVEALNIFHKIKLTSVDTNIITWTTMISTHA